MLRAFRRFVSEDKGSVAPIFSVALIALVGMGGLAWDVSRAFALRAELDAAVDAAALAGATQLDGKAGAMARATAAAQGALISNSQRLATAAENSVTIAVTDIAYLQDLTTRAVATTDADAQFIEIDLTPRNLGVVMGAVVGASDFNVGTHAVAGYGSALCKVPPLMICNPAETATELTFNGNQYTGKAFILTPPPGGSTQWGPGNFGFLSVGTGANAIKDAMGRNPPLSECFGETAESEPGNISSADDWFNTRFDIYRASAAGNKTDPAFAPSLNTLIGSQSASSDTCTPTLAVPANPCPSDTAAVATGFGFPRDCGQTSGVGTGEWAAQKYFNTNHAGRDPLTWSPPAPSNANYAGAGWAAYGPPAVAGATTPTRFQVYNWELAMLNNGQPNTRPQTPRDPSKEFTAGQMGSTGTADFAAPMCNTTNDDPVAPDRRTISAVVVNCKADNVRGRTTVNIVSVVDLFLIAPAKDAVIYGEFIEATSDVSAVGVETRLHSVRLYE